jgi:hypothetical protein
MNVQFDESELATLRLLDGLLRDPAVHAAIDPVASRVAAQLDADSSDPLAWEPLPLSIYGNTPTCNSVELGLRPPRKKRQRS